jgi:hypothetical protein
LAYSFYNLRRAPVLLDRYSLCETRLASLRSWQGRPSRFHARFDRPWAINCAEYLEEEVMRKSAGLFFKVVSYPIFLISSLFMAERAASYGQFSFSGLAGLFAAFAFYWIGDAFNQKSN